MKKAEEVKTELRYCNHCKKETEQFKVDNKIGRICRECFMNPEGSKK